RERGKMERRTLGYRVDEFSESKDVTARIPDPPAYLEQQRATYIAEIEACARACEIPTERAELFLKLLKFTSLGKVRVDVTAQLGKLAPEVDLRALSDEQVAATMRGETIDVRPAEVREAEGSVGGAVVIRSRSSCAEEQQRNQ